MGGAQNPVLEAAPANLLGRYEKWLALTTSVPTVYRIKKKNYVEHGLPDTAECIYCAQLTLWSMAFMVTGPYLGRRNKRNYFGLLSRLLLM